MKRREFIIGSGLLTGGLLAGISAAERRPASLEIKWTREAESGLFTAVSCEGTPLVQGDSPGLLDGFCRLAGEEAGQAACLTAKRPKVVHGPLRAELRHRLHQSGNGEGEDLLEATLTLVNISGEAQTTIVGFATSAQPSADWTKQSIFIPLSATCDHPAMGDLRKAAHKQADYAVGQRAFTAHYLEPLASDPPVRTPVAPLLVPVLDIYHADVQHRVGLMTTSGQARRFATIQEDGRSRGWSAQTVVTLAPGQEFTDRCLLMIHRGDATKAWSAFHRFAHREDWPAIDWLAGVRVHYYDFLSAADPAGRRGDGYEAAIPHFREFHVGLATQHGYYPCMGDYICPDRPAWLAMQKDRNGPAPMSFDKIKARLKATREAGARAAIYMHLTALDDSSEKFFPKLRSARLVGHDGQPVKYPWNGPDVKGGLWQMSMAAPQWRAHLLQQARWIMEIFQPDAIVVDETFTGLGYDEHPARRGPLSPYSVEFFKQLQSVVRSYGKDRALLTSDCAMSGFALWADGECGDHAYDTLLGDPNYRRPPLRYRAVLGDKPWLPCAWDFRRFWNQQMELARSSTRTGVGVSNGWIEFTGLHRLPAAERAKMTADIATLF